MAARLPVPGSDDGTWGSILNDFLLTSHNNDGTLKTSAITQAGGLTSSQVGAATGVAGLDGSSHVPTAQLGGGTPSGSNFLRGDGIWAVPAGGSSTLAGDSDVSIVSPNNNQVLTYNNGTGKWTNQAPAVQSVFGRTGAITAQNGDYTAAQVGALPSTDDLSAIAAANATAANVSLNSHKITSLANGTAASDAAAFGQIPTSLPPNGTAGGDLSGNYPNPTVAKVNGIALPASAPTGSGQVLTSTSASATAWQTPASAPVTSVFTRTGAITAQSGDYTAAQITNAADKSSVSAQTFTGNVSAPAHIASGLTGATATSRYVGATVSGAPASGTFATGDFVIDQTAKIWVCTAAGSPGTWTQITASNGGVTSFNSRGGAVTPQSGDYTAAQVGALASTSDLSAIATANATAGDVAMNTHKVTGLANGTVATDGAAFGQIPTTLPPSGSATGDLTASYPSPKVAKIQGVSVSGTAPTTGQTMVYNGTSWTPTLITVPPKHGWWYPNDSPNGGNMTMTNNTLWLFPWDLAFTVTIEAVGVSVGAAGSAGSVIRLGLYASDGAGYVGSLIQDFGTVSGTSTGVQSVTGLSLSAGPDRLWLAAVGQGSPTTAVQVLKYNRANPMIGWSSFYGFPPIVGYNFTGVTSALPSNVNSLTASPENSACPGVKMQIL